MNLRIMTLRLCTAILPFAVTATQSIALAAPSESSYTPQYSVHPILGRRPLPLTGNKARTLTDELLKKNKLAAPLDNPKSIWITSWGNCKRIRFEGEPGEPVRSAATGKVMYSGWYSGNGKVVIILHPHKLTCMYAHLSKILVSNGDQVKQGQPIGIVGKTGYVQNKMHQVCFEIRQNLNRPPITQQPKVNRIMHLDRISDQDKHTEQHKKKSAIEMRIFQFILNQYTL